MREGFFFSLSHESPFFPCTSIRSCVYRACLSARDSPSPSPAPAPPAPRTLAPPAPAPPCGDAVAGVSVVTERDA